MVITLVSWCLITFFVVSAGTIIDCILKRFFNISIRTIDSLLIAGIMGLTVYSGLFSVVYKVGLVANLILLLIGIALLFLPVGRNKWLHIWTKLTNTSSKTYYIRLTLSILIILIALYVGSSVETFYDTELYHGQAIRWIEEYGIVKGLGLLHSRFSYNSCFMPLQALFGFKWLFGIELRNLNAYLSALLSVWAVNSFSFWKKNTFTPADGLRCVLLIFTWIFQLPSLSSPNSDYLALSMAIYVCAMLLDTITQELSGNSDNVFMNDTVTGNFLLASFFAVFAISLKLSVAMLVLVALYPAFVLIKNKEWKKIIYAIIFGFIIISPYLIRNIIISGYLVYPYTQIDLFDVTWKVTKSLADYDRKEIMVWGKSLNDTEMYDYSLFQWLPIWWSNVEHVYRRILEVSFVLIAGAFIKCVCTLFSKKNSKVCLTLYIYGVCAAMLLMWFLSAPLLRYGMVFALLIPGMFVGDILSGNSNILIKLSKYIRALGIAGASLVGLVCIGFSIYYLKDVSSGVIMPQPYQTIENRTYDYDGLTLYYAMDGTDWVGYHDFPAIPYEPDPACLGIVDTTDLSKGFWNAEVYYSMDSTVMKPLADE